MGNQLHFDMTKEIQYAKILYLYGVERRSVVVLIRMFENIPGTEHVVAAESKPAV